MRRMVAAQFGEVRRDPVIACALISGIMSGEVERNAELESMQRHLAFGIKSL